MPQLAERYALERVLRDDGAGTVHEGSDPKSGDRVLVSLATADALPEARERLQALVEARVVQRASSPSLARLRAGGHDDPSGDPFLVQSVVEGPRLDERLAAEPALTVEQAIRLVVELLAGLGALHRHGLSHGDVCPRNVVVLERLVGITPRLVNLGVNAAPYRAARAAWADTEELSSLAYASPEQASREELASPASDVYSAACVLYGLLAGRAPFAGSDERSLRREVAAGDVESLGAIEAFAGSEVASLLDRALHADRSVRFAKADELQQALRKSLLSLGALRAHALPVGARFEATPPPPPPEGPTDSEADGFFSAEDWADAAPDSIAPPPRGEEPAAPVPDPRDDEGGDEGALSLELDPDDGAPPARRLYAPVDPAEFGLDDDDEEEEESTRVGVVSEALLQTMRDLDEPDEEAPEASQKSAPEPVPAERGESDEEEEDEPTRARVVQPEMLELLGREEEEGAVERSAAGAGDRASAPPSVEQPASEQGPLDTSLPPPQPVGSLPPPSLDDAPRADSLRPAPRSKSRAALWIVVVLALAVLSAVAWNLWMAPPS